MKYFDLKWMISLATVLVTVVLAWANLSNQSQQSTKDLERIESDARAREVKVIENQRTLALLQQRLSQMEQRGERIEGLIERVLEELRKR